MRANTGGNTLTYCPTLTLAFSQQCQTRRFAYDSGEKQKLSDRKIWNYP
jgi:hypothetical protein